MLKVPQILVRAITLVGGAALLIACGQKGALILPTETAARQRATLPQTLKPDWARSRDATQPGAPVRSTPPAVVAPPTDAELVPETADPGR